MNLTDSNGRKNAFVHIEDGDIIASSEGIDVIIAEYNDLVRYDFDVNGVIEGESYTTENGLKIELHDFIHSISISKEQHIQLARLAPHEGSGTVPIGDDDTSSERLDHFVTILQDKLDADIDNVT